MRTKIIYIAIFAVLLLTTKITIYASLVYKICCLKIWLCKFFDKSQVCICEHLRTSEHILNTSENLYRISLINWGHPENIWKQLRTSENISGTSENISGTYENISGTSENIWHHPEKKCPHRGWLCIKVAAQLKTSENSWEHRKTFKIIWYHPENNWGPIIDNLVQIEEDFNSRTKKWVRWGGVDWIG